MRNVGRAAASGGTVGERPVGMIPFQKQIMHRVVSPPATAGLAPGITLQEEEPMLQDEADPSQVEPTIAPDAPVPGNTDPLAQEELETLARGLMSNLNQMVDMMLRGPLPSLCQEEGEALHRRFTGSSSPKQ